MRITAITSNQNYKQSNKPQIIKNNMTNTQYQQSFGSFQPFGDFARGGVSLISRVFGIEEKAVKPQVGLSQVALKAVMEEVKKSVMHKYTEKNFVKTAKQWINEENIQFVSSLLKKAKSEEEQYNKLWCIEHLATVYKNCPKSRPLLEKVSKTDFSLKDLGEPFDGIFGEKYVDALMEKGSPEDFVMWNKFIENMIDSERLTAYGISETQKVLSPETEGFIYTLLAQRKNATRRANFKEMSKIITSEPSPTSDIEQSRSAKRGSYLIDKNGKYLKEIVELHHKGNDAAIRDLLPYAQSGKDITGIIWSYRPSEEHDKIVARMIPLIAKGKASVKDLVKVLERN